MELITEEIRAKLLANGTGSERGKDHWPVVKLFATGRAATWLLTELDPENPEIAFGLCDPGHGFPELGIVSLAEIAQLPRHIMIERDLHWKATAPLSKYANMAREAKRIIDHL